MKPVVSVTALSYVYLRNASSCVRCRRREKWGNLGRREARYMCRGVMHAIVISENRRRIIERNSAKMKSISKMKSKYPYLQNIVLRKPLIKAEEGAIIRWRSGALRSRIKNGIWPMPVNNMRKVMSSQRNINTIKLLAVTSFNNDAWERRLFPARKCEATVAAKLSFKSRRRTSRMSAQAHMYSLVMVSVRKPAYVMKRRLKLIFAKVCKCLSEACFRGRFVVVAYEMYGDEERYTPLLTLRNRYLWQRRVRNILVFGSDMALSAPKFCRNTHNQKICI